MQVKLFWHRVFIVFWNAELVILNKLGNARVA
jgi:hypothetical protein